MTKGQVKSYGAICRDLRDQFGLDLVISKELSYLESGGTGRMYSVVDGEFVQFTPTGLYTGREIEVMMRGFQALLWRIKNKEVVSK